MVEKKHIKAAARKWELPLWANPCPSAGSTSRSDMAETLQALYGVTGNARRCIFKGLSRWQFAKEEAKATGTMPAAQNLDCAARSVGPALPEEESGSACAGGLSGSLSE